MNLTGQQLRSFTALALILAASACSGDSSGPIEVEPSFTEGVVDGQLKIIKRVVNDNGGTATVAAFGVNTSAGALTFGAGVPDGPNTLAYSSQVITVTAGTSYTLRENDIAGYAEGTWSCEGATPTNNTITGGAVTAVAGIRVDCTITNDDLAPPSGSLRIIKRVVNDHGGTATVAAFGLNTSAGALTFGAGVPDGTSTLAYASQVITVAPGSYTLVENDIAGYTEGTWTCAGATPTNNTITAGAVTVPANTPVVCTITNDDVTVPNGSLKIVKRVVNDNGGTATVAAFGVNTSAGALTFGAGVPDGASTLAYSSQVISVARGSYTLRENDVLGYFEGTWTCEGATPSNNTIIAGAVTVPSGVAVVCTITNNDASGSLKIVKRVVNDNGGSATVAAFGVNTSAGALTFGAGIPDGPNTLAYLSQTITVLAGVSYTLRENDIAGYAEGTWTCEGATPSNNTISAGAVTVPANTPVVCTITNDDVTPTGQLKITKRVVNDNGSTATVAAFGVSTTAGALVFDGGTPDGANTIAYTSQVLTVTGGVSYTLRENDIAGYSEGTWSCVGATPTNNTISAGAVTAVAGIRVDCTITNDDVAPTGHLKIIKRVVNDNGGTATVSAFGVNTSAGTLTFDAGTPDGPNTIAYTSQVLTVTGGVGYTLRENDIAGYTEGTWSCVGATPTNNTISAGAVTAVAGIRVDCTITNTDLPGTVSQITRTQGFWSTHRSITTAAWFGGSVGGNTFAGVADRSICDGAAARELDTIGKVLGGFWSNIAKTSTGAHRSALDHARMQLAQQLLAAILNNAAFGSSPSGSISIADARAAFCGTDISAIKAAHEAMAEFNESGDDEAFTPGAPGNGRDAKDNADLVFWNALP